MIRAHNASRRTDPTRRGLLTLVAATPAGVFAAAAFGQAAFGQAVCVDLAALPSSQRSMRKSLGFMVASDDPKRQCGGCGFFTATDGGCGKCAIFNGPVPSSGRCDSWAPRKP